MTYTSATAILASDFSTDTTDVLRNRWTVAKVRHLIAALDGSPVVITTEAGTGHTLVGVKLINAFNGGPSRGDRVTVEIEYAPGETQRTNYYLPTVGLAIIPLTATHAKWDALQSYREEGSAAIASAMQDHGDAEGRSWGKWTATPGESSVSVTYEPHTGNAAFADRWGTRGHWTYPLSFQVVSLPKAVQS